MGRDSVCVTAQVYLTAHSQHLISRSCNLLCTRHIGSCRLTISTVTLLMMIVLMVPASCQSLGVCVTSSPPPDDMDALDLTTLGLRNGCNVFVWDGVQVGGVKPCTGPESEPVLLTIHYPSEAEEDHRKISKGFPRNLTLQELKVCVGCMCQLFICVSKNAGIC